MSLKKESSSDTGEEKQKPKKAGKRGKKTFLVVGAVAVIAVAAAASYFFFGMNEAGSFFNGRPAHAEKEKQKPKQVVDLGDVVVNLADSGSTHYLRVTIVLEFFENKKLDEELKNKNHQVKDTIISLLRNKTAKDVQIPSNTEELKRQILEKVNELLDSGKVERAYFTEYLVQ